MNQDVSPSPFASVDQKAFAADIDALYKSLKADVGPADLSHLFKMVRWTRILTILGYAVAWIIPNPVSIFLLGLANMARWAVIAHPVIHRGYDGVEGVPPRYTSKLFAVGWRRMWDWMDWLDPASWAHEHNQLHHFQTGQQGDPDLVERNAWLLRHPALPRPIKALLIVFVMFTWKLSYYAPNTFFALKQHEKIRAQSKEQALIDPQSSMAETSCFLIPGEKVMLPITRWGLEFWIKCVLPYGVIKFGVIPLLFLPLGVKAWVAVLINVVLAEFVANALSFLVIAPNHTGDDVYRFESGCKSRADFYLQQCAGTVNYTGGTDVKDFLQGYLNYQIEHHLWPALPMLKYRQAAPQLKAICQKHGVPYIEENVFRRFRKLWAILMGDRHMKKAGTPSCEFNDPLLS